MKPLIFNFKETLQEIPSRGIIPIVTVTVNGKQWGDPLEDKSYKLDGYRYHDVFHLGFYALTGGQSPVTRLFLDNADPLTKPPQAWSLEREEVLSILAFNEAKNFGFYKKRRPSQWLINTLNDLSEGSDLHAARGRWRPMLKTIYPVFNQLVENKGGNVLVDPVQKKLQYLNKNNNL